jgi:hypothetical protein
MKMRQTASTASQTEVRPIEPPLLSDQVGAGQQVYDTRGTQVGKGALHFPLYLLRERGRIFPQVHDVPFSPVAQVEGPSPWPSIASETLKALDFALLPLEIHDIPAPLTSEDHIDISDVSSPVFSLISAETGYSHYEPHSPGINTNAGGSYTPGEIDLQGRQQDHLVRPGMAGNGRKEDE